MKKIIALLALLSGTAFGVTPTTTLKPYVQENTVGTNGCYQINTSPSCSASFVGLSAASIPNGNTGYAQINPTATQYGNVNVSSITAPASLTVSQYVLSSTGSWAAGNVMPTALQYGTLIKMTTSDDLIYFGGVNTAGTPLTAVNYFTAATGLWTAAPVMNAARALSTSIGLCNGDTLTVGGEDVSKTTNLATTAVRNATTGVWSAGATMNEARAGAGMALLPNCDVLVFGGNKPAGGGISYSSSTEILHAGVFVSSNPMPSTMAYPSVWTDTTTNRVFISGGDVNNTTVGSTAVYYLNGNFTVIPGFTGLSTSFNGANEAVDSLNKLYLMAGSGPPTGGASQVCEVLDTKAVPLQWVQISSLPVQEVCSGVFAEQNNRIICTRGVSAGHFASNVNYEFTPETNSWNQNANMPNVSGYSSFNMSGPQPVLSDGRFVLPAGADDSASSQNTVNIFSPSLNVSGLGVIRTSINGGVVYSSSFSIVNASSSTSVTSYVSSGLKAQITPKTRASRIKITVSGSATASGAISAECDLNISNTGVTNLSINPLASVTDVAVGVTGVGAANFTWIDSPGTTNTTTYTVLIKAAGTTPTCALASTGANSTATLLVEDIGPQ